MLRIGPNIDSNENSAINIIKDTQRVGIKKEPTGEYVLDVSGPINCDAVFVNGKQIGTTKVITTLDMSGAVTIRRN